jgi:hypothetical protein
MRHEYLGCLVLAGMPNHLPVGLDVLEGTGGDSSKKTEILHDGDEKTQILDSPQHMEAQLLGAETSKM